MHRLFQIKSSFLFLCSILHIFGLLSAQSPSLENKAVDKYSAWKTHIELEWNNKNYTLIQRLDQLVGLLKKPLPSKANLDKKREDEYLNNYNTARDLLHLPLAQSMSEVDKNFVSELAEILATHKLAQTRGFHPPSPGMKELVQEAQTLMNIKDKIIILAHPEVKGGSAALGESLALCQMPDLDFTIYVLYHELGHLVYKDSDVYTCLKEIDLRCRDAVQMPKPKDLLILKKYIELALTKINDQSDVGKRIINALKQLKAKNLSIYDFIDKKSPGMEPPLTYDVIVRRNTERRADLYAMTNLFQRNKIDPILTGITYFEPGEFDTKPAGGAMTHPSFLERALYTIGFLFEKGIDANAVIKNYEEQGTCLNRELLAQQPSPTAEAFDKEYARWRNEEYQIWKNAALGGYEKRQFLFNEKVISLIETIDLNQREVDAAPRNPEDNPSYPGRAYYQKQMLHAYNTLRDLFSLPRVHAVYEIDQQWTLKLSQQYARGLFDVLRRIVKEIL
jgi:hypothetical protein